MSKKFYPIQDWVNEVGGFHKAAALVGVTHYTVMFWYYRRGTPKIDWILALIEKSNGKLSFQSILKSTGWEKRKGATCEQPPNQ